MRKNFARNFVSSLARLNFWYNAQVKLEMLLVLVLVMDLLLLLSLIFPHIRWKKRAFRGPQQIPLCAYLWHICVWMRLLVTNLFCLTSWRVVAGRRKGCCWRRILKRGIELFVESYSRNMLCTSKIIYHLIMVALTVNQLISLCIYFSISVRFWFVMLTLLLAYIFFSDLYITPTLLSSLYIWLLIAIAMWHIHTMEVMYLWRGLLYGYFIISGGSALCTQKKSQSLSISLVALLYPALFIFFIPPVP